MRKNNKSLFISVLFIIVTLLCVAIKISTANLSVPNDERIFDSIISSLAKILTKIDKIPIEEIRKNGKIFFSTKKKTKYIYKNVKKLEQLEEALNKFILDYPGNRWIDDALVCIGIKYIVISTKERPLTQNALIAYQAILDLSDITLEPKTKTYFKNLSISFIFSSPPYEEWIGELDEEIRLKIIFARAKIIEYLKIGDFQGARNEIKNITKKKILNFKKNIESLKEIINDWEEKYKEHDFVPSSIKDNTESFSRHRLNTDTRY